MNKISETDLILNEDGSVYHLNLLPKHIGDTIIAVGDPNRVNQVSQHFDSVDFEMNKREFITHTGVRNGKRISVISTGIGTDNIEIFLTELDALVNIDLKTREPKSRKKKLRIVRVGTSGAVQEDIPVGSLLVSEYAIGFDNLMNFYNLPMDSFEQEIAQDIREKIKLNFTPYVVKGSEALCNLFRKEMIVGNTLTAPGFYSPQGRAVRIAPRYPNLLEDIIYYHNKNSDFWFTNIEMETAGYYSLARMLGHEVISINAILANRVKNKFAKNPNRVVDNMIVKVLDLLV